jgi:hypothetical protein
LERRSFKSKPRSRPPCSCQLELALIIEHSFKEREIDMTMNRIDGSTTTYSLLPSEDNLATALGGDVTAQIAASMLHSAREARDAASDARHATETRRKRKSKSSTCASKRTGSEAQGTGRPAPRSSAPSFSSLAQRSALRRAPAKACTLVVT